MSAEVRSVVAACHRTVEVPVEWPGRVYDLSACAYLDAADSALATRPAPWWTRPLTSVPAHAAIAGAAIANARALISGRDLRICMVEPSLGSVVWKQGSTRGNPVATRQPGRYR